MCEDCTDTFVFEVAVCGGLCVWVGILPKSGFWVVREWYLRAVWLNHGVSWVGFLRRVLFVLMQHAASTAPTEVEGATFCGVWFGNGVGPLGLARGGVLLRVALGVGLCDNAAL